MLVLVEDVLVSSFVKLMVSMESFVERGTQCTIFERVCLGVCEWNNFARLGTKEGDGGGGFGSPAFGLVKIPLSNFLHVVSTWA